MSKYKILLLSILFFSVFAFPQIAKAADYYVATNGNDANPGTLSAPFKTIQKGVNVAVNSGDVVNVLPGIYRQTSGSVDSSLVEIIDKHGQVGNNIVLRAYDSNDPPTLMGYGHAIRIIGSTYYTVDGFDITDTYHAAITTGLADYITIQNNHIHFGFTGFCDGTETAPDPFVGCTVGAIKGRYYTTGVPIIEYDEIQNPGMHFCKTTNSQILNNHIENADEALYVGSSGNVGSSDCYYAQYNDGRLWTEGNLISGNLIENAMDEAIELKSDTRNNIVQNNVVRSTRRNWGSTMIEIRGHYNEINQNIVVGAPLIAIRTHSENPGDPGPDRIEEYQFVRKVNNIDYYYYMSSYRNYIHHNYVYYFSEFAASGYGIVSNDTSAANRVEHNTIVGVNHFPGEIIEYFSLKTQSNPKTINRFDFRETIISDNLMVGNRRITDVNANRSEYHLVSSTGYLPLTSDYNAYYPRLKANNTCVVSMSTPVIICQNNVNTGFEAHSQFMDTNPIRSDESLCSKDQLFTIPMTQLSDRIKYCSAPLTSAAIVSTASDGTNIGAWQELINPSPSPTPTPNPADINHIDGVNAVDLFLVLRNWLGIGSCDTFVCDLNSDNKINALDAALVVKNWGL